VHRAFPGWIREALEAPDTSPSAVTDRYSAQYPQSQHSIMRRTDHGTVSADAIPIE
jgi:hypothetical protein